MAKKTAKTKIKKEYLLGLLIVIIFGFLLWHKSSTSPVLAPAPSAGPTPITATFTCPNGDPIKATFDNVAGNVTVVLPDGTTETLPQAMSADGSRYENSDESFVFWNVGNSASVEQNGVTTYENCATDTN